jgi:hypothetical protein
MENLDISFNIILPDKKQYIAQKLKNMKLSNRKVYQMTLISYMIADTIAWGMYCEFFLSGITYIK